MIEAVLFHAELVDLRGIFEDAGEEFTHHDPSVCSPSAVSTGSGADGTREGVGLSWGLSVGPVTAAGVAAVPLAWRQVSASGCQVCADGCQVERSGTHASASDAGASMAIVGAGSTAAGGSDSSAGMRTGGVIGAKGDGRGSKPDAGGSGRGLAVSMTMYETDSSAGCSTGGGDGGGSSAASSASASFPSSSWLTGSSSMRLSSASSSSSCCRVGFSEPGVRVEMEVGIGASLSP